MIRFCLCAAFALIATGSASAQSPPQTIRAPKIETTLSAETLARYFPAIAQRLGLSGMVGLKCEVGLDHRLKNCAVTSETPVGFGFGEAALKLATEFQVSPRRVNGVDQDGGIFSTRINFAKQENADPSAGSDAVYMLVTRWAKKPTPDQIQAAYPAKAHSSGVVKLLCHAYDSGDIGACIILTEIPYGQGFGEAALTLAPLFQTDRAVRAPAGETLFVTIPITLDPPKSP